MAVTGPVGLPDGAVGAPDVIITVVGGSVMPPDDGGDVLSVRGTVRPPPVVTGGGGQHLLSACCHSQTAMASKTAMNNRAFFMGKSPSAGWSIGLSLRITQIRPKSYTFAQLFPYGTHPAKFWQNGNTSIIIAFLN